MDIFLETTIQEKIMKIIMCVIALIRRDSKTAHRYAKQLKLDRLLERLNISGINIHWLQNLFITNEYLGRTR